MLVHLIVFYHIVFTVHGTCSHVTQGNVYENLHNTASCRQDFWILF